MDSNNFLAKDGKGHDQTNRKHKAIIPYPNRNLHKTTGYRDSENILRAEQAKEEWNGIQAINNSGLAYQTDWRNEMMRRHQERKPGMELQFYNSYIKNLEDIRKSLTGIKNRLDQQ